MVATTRNEVVRITTAPSIILDRNDKRSSYYILNQHATLAIWVASGESNGAHVTVAGNHMGERIAPNGGSIFDNQDQEVVYAISTGVNALVLVREVCKSGVMERK